MTPFEQTENDQFVLYESNKIALSEYLNSLICRFEKETDSSSESVNRIITLQNALNIAFERGSEEKLDRFFELSHEIESYLFLKQFGNVYMSSDMRHEEGADYVFNSQYYIECVCSTPGEKKKNGLDKYLLRTGSFDYNEFKRLLYARFTSSLYEKADFYKKHINKSIPEGAPYLIFCSPGRLLYNWFPEQYGIAFTDILFGRGFPTITVDEKTGEIVESGYSHTLTFEKYNGKEISSNLFCTPDFRCVSCIILASGIKEEYTSENTFLFINPFADNPILPSLFHGVPTWKRESGSSYRVYIDNVPI